MAHKIEPLIRNFLWGFTFEGKKYSSHHRSYHIITVKVDWEILQGKFGGFWKEASVYMYGVEVGVGSQRR